MFRLSDRNKMRLAAVAVFLSPLLLYLPSLGNGYVGWDDGIILEDVSIRSLSPENVLSFFVPRSGGTVTWQPMRSLAFAAVYAISGFNPAGYIVLNILLYSLSVLLCFLVVHRLMLLWPERFTRRQAGQTALISAAIFAFHPLHVEAVSWLQGGKFSLMTVFCLGSCLAWLRFRQNGRIATLAAALGLYLCGLASQPAAVALPLVLLGGEMLLPATGVSKGKRIAATGVFFLPMMAVAFQVVFLSTVTHTSSAGAPLSARILMLPLLWSEYLLKFFLPVNLCCRYPLNIPESAPWLRGLTAAGVLAVATWTGLRASGRLARPAGFGLFLAAAALLPTSGLVPTSTLMADRYFFLPSVGLALVAGLAGMSLAGRIEKAGRIYTVIGAVCALTVMSVMGAVNVRRQLDWRDPFSLWQRVMRVYPGHDLAAFNLADAHQRTGDLAAADSLYRLCLKLNPSSGDAYGNLGVVLRTRGDSSGAFMALQRAAQLRPDRGAVWVNLGISYAGFGRDSLALAAFERALNLKDKWEWQARYNRAKLIFSHGQTGQAVAEMENVARNWPGRLNAETWLDLGRTLERAGRGELALELLEKGEQEGKFDSHCWQLLGNLQLMQGQTTEAIASLEKALEMDPRDWRTLVLIGSYWQQSGGFEQAAGFYERALAAPSPDAPRVFNYLALSRAAAGQKQKALDAWRASLSADPSYIEGWINLGLYLRELGREEQARLSLSRALGLCGDRTELTDVRTRLNALLDSTSGRQ